MSPQRKSPIPYAERNRRNARRYMTVKRATPEGRAYLNGQWREWANGPGRARRDVLHQKRRAIQAGALMVVRVDLDHCGVCLRPLVESARFPDPMATTIGHEPPLAIVKRDGWKIVVERPEHWRCNVAKSDKTDAELAA